MRESAIQKKVTSYLRSLDYPCNKTTGAGARGWPDITTVINGRFVSFEMKAPGKLPTIKQQYVGIKILKNGGIWLSYDNAEDCYDAIDYIEGLGKVTAVDYDKMPKSLQGKGVACV